MGRQPFAGFGCFWPFTPALVWPGRTCHSDSRILQLQDHVVELRPNDNFVIAFQNFINILRCGHSGGLPCLHNRRALILILILAAVIELVAASSKVKGFTKIGGVSARVGIWPATSAGVEGPLRCRSWRPSFRSFPSGPVNLLDFLVTSLELNTLRQKGLHCTRILSHPFRSGSAVHKMLDRKH